MCTQNLPPPAFGSLSIVEKVKRREEFAPSHPFPLESLIMSHFVFCTVFFNKYTKGWADPSLCCFFDFTALLSLVIALLRNVGVIIICDSCTHLILRLNNAHDAESLSLSPVSASSADHLSASFLARPLRGGPRPSSIPRPNITL